MSSIATNNVLAHAALMHTTRVDYRAGRRVWQETTEAVYHDQLGAVPPAFATHGVFAMGEPENHDGRGRPVFRFFAAVQGRYFAQLGTITDYKAGLFGPLPV